jgi:uncharacterized membrane protein
VQVALFHPYGETLYLLSQRIFHSKLSITFLAAYFSIIPVEVYTRTFYKPLHIF